MVVFLYDGISGCFIVPSIQTKFGYSIHARSMYFDVSVFEIHSRSSDPVQYIIVSLSDCKTAPSQCSNKGSSRWVNNHLTDIIPLCQFLHAVAVVLIRSLYGLFSAVVVVFLYPRCLVSQNAPQASRKRIHRAVVD